MALPQLYRDLTLISYDKIRYRDDFPEGCGSASPFSMGLNAVVTRKSVASLVRSFALRGEWREDGLEEYARVGRVPDSSMMLNITLRVAIERMAELKSFSWEMNTKLLEPVYAGLAQLPKLTSLTIRFPSSRHPRPTIMIPPMPHVRALKVTHIDPLCYPDDLSTFFVHSKKLRDLKLHWSSRMREEQEPSVTLNHYFRKCISMNAPMRLRKFAMQNFYALHTDDFENAFDIGFIEDVTILNSQGAIDTGMMSFVDASWPNPAKSHHRVKSMRFDRVDKRGCEFISDVTALERLYLVHPVVTTADLINSARPSSSLSTSTLSPSSGEVSMNGYATAQTAQNTAPPSFSSQAMLRDSYIHMITDSHGAKLRHLLLPSRWALPSSAIGRLVRHCPNLEQLGLATEMSAFDTVALLLPFLRKLQALRLLIPTPLPTSNSTSNPTSSRGTPTANPPSYPGSNPYGHPHGSVPSVQLDSLNPTADTARAIAEIVSLDDVIQERAIGLKLGDEELYGNLKVFGLGWKAWELGSFYTAPVSEAMPPPTSGANAENGPADNLMNTSGPIPMSGNIGTNVLPSDGDVRLWTYAPSPPQTSSASVLGKRKDRGHDESRQDHARPPPLSQQQQQPQLRHDQLPASAPTITPYPHATPHHHSTPHPHPHQHPHTQAPPPPRSQSRPQPQPQPPLHPLHHDMTLRTFTGETVSEHTRLEILRCLEHPEVNTPGMNSGRSVPEGMVLRRHVKRANWTLLKEWEIWGLDLQEI